MMAPDRPRAAPTASAMSATGSRMDQTMACTESSTG